MKRTPNTFDAHKLIWLAGREGVQDKTVDAIFNGYFVEGKDVGNLDTLIEIATAVGMNAERVRAFLEGEEGTDAIYEAEAKGRALRINSVPHFIINDQISVSGAQSVETFIKAFEQAMRAATA